VSEAVATEAVERTRRLAADAERVVVKAGTSSLTDASSKLDDDKLDKLVDDLVSLLDRGKEVLLVSSGAVGAGTGRIGYTGETVEEAQALSTIGQSHLMRRYAESFERYDRKVAQVLLTEHDFENTERYTNLGNTIETLLEWGVVPIINENDAVATTEIQIGDNDILSASLAVGVDADLLVTLTDVRGVYPGNPNEESEIDPIEAVGHNYDEVEAMVEESSTSEFGGIRTKVRGARDVSEHGVPAVIAAAAERDVLERIAAGESVGTIFIPVEEQANP
jgi:glutamate 5-kinase